MQLWILRTYNKKIKFNFKFHIWTGFVNIKSTVFLTKKSDFEKLKKISQIEGRFSFIIFEDFFFEMRHFCGIFKHFDL